MDDCENSQRVADKTGVVAGGHDFGVAVRDLSQRIRDLSRYERLDCRSSRPIFVRGLARCAVVSAARGVVGEEIDSDAAGSWVV